MIPNFFATNGFYQNKLSTSRYRIFKDIQATFKNMRAKRLQVQIWNDMLLTIKLTILLMRSVSNRKKQNEIPCIAYIS